MKNIAFLGFDWFQPIGVQHFLIVGIANLTLFMGAKLRQDIVYYMFCKYYGFQRELKCPPFGSLQKIKHQSNGVNKL